jgi:hypothetical protein
LATTGTQILEELTASTNNPIQAVPKSKDEWPDSQTPRQQTNNVVIVCGDMSRRIPPTKINTNLPFILRLTTSKTNQKSPSKLQLLNSLSNNCSFFVIHPYLTIVMDTFYVPTTNFRHRSQFYVFLVPINKIKLRINYIFPSKH